MESCLSEIIEQLQQLLRSTKVKESKLLGQVLLLEKIINNTQKVVPQIVKKQTIKPIQKQQKKEKIKQSVQSQITAFLNEIQMKQKQLQNDQISKPELKFPEIIIQKKPPIPTVNRAQKSLKANVPAYIPPRNKNEVTGKVTQATIRTPNQKVFKPQIVNSIRSNSKEIIKTKQTVSKSNNSIESKLIKKETSNKQIKAQQPKRFEKINDMKNDKNEINKIEVKQLNKKIQQVQKEKVDPSFTVFAKDIQQLLDQIMSKGTKNRKSQLQKLIKQVQNEEIGYKKNEEEARFSCIKQINNYSYSRHRVIKTNNHSIQRSKWHYSPQIFQLQLLINDLQNQLSSLRNQKQYKIDVKQEYRIIKQFKVLQELISQAQEKASNVPNQLQLTFNFKPVSFSQPEKEEDNYYIYETSLNQKLANLVDLIQESGTLQKNQLRYLQILSQIGIFKCKKTPILTMSEQYESWKNYYFTNG